MKTASPLSTAIVSEMVDPELLLRFVGVTETHHFSSQIRCCCPIHLGDGEYNFSYDLRTNTWRCFSRNCGEGLGYRRDAVLLVQLVLGVTREEAYKIVRQLAGVDELSSITKEQLDAYRVRSMVRQCEMMKKRSPDAIDPIEVNLDSMDIESAVRYLRRRGYGDAAKAIVSYFGLGVATKGRLRGRLVIPIYDVDGRLVGASGRTIRNEEPKYKHLYNSRCGLTLYNIANALPYISVLGTVYVVEGFFDVFRMVSYGYHNTVALMGTNMSLDQARLLMTASEVVLLLDGDEAGQKASERIAQRLRPYMNKVRIVSLPNGMDVDSAPFDELQARL